MMLLDIVSCAGAQGKADIKLKQTTRYWHIGASPVNSWHLVPVMNVGDTAYYPSARSFACTRSEYSC